MFCNIKNYNHHHISLKFKICFNIIYVNNLPLLSIHTHFKTNDIAKKFIEELSNKYTPTENVSIDGQVEIKNQITSLDVNNLDNIKLVPRFLLVYIFYFAKPPELKDNHCDQYQLDILNFGEYPCTDIAFVQ